MERPLLWAEKYSHYLMQVHDKAYWRELLESFQEEIKQ
jgi:hypothetical protein